MTLAAAFPQTIHLNPLQQWRYFSQPRAMHDWLRERYGGLVSLHFQDRNFAGILTAEGARQPDARARQAAPRRGHDQAHPTVSHR